MSDDKPKPAAGNRLAKVIARAGMCSRREAETWITAGRVSVNGNTIRTPAFNVTDDDKVTVDNNPLADRAGTRVWLYHKPGGLVVTEKDPEGRPTIFKELEKKGLPRVLTIGRLDINTEGLLMLTNDGGLKRVLELPATGWLRRYRVRAHGKVTQEQLDKLKKGIEVGGVKYGPIEAELERVQGANVWIRVALREGKNREIKNVLSELGLQVNRLIRTSYGPFQLGDIPIGVVTVVRARILRDQLGHKLAKQAGVDFDSPLPEDEIVDPKLAAQNPNQRMGKNKRSTSKLISAPKPHGRTGEQKPEEETAEKPRRSAPQRKGNFEFRPRAPKEVPPVEKRIVHFTDGRASEEFELKAKRKKPDDEDDRGSFKGRSGPERGPRRDDGDRPRGPRREGGERSRGPRRDDGDRPRGPRRESASSDKPRSARPPRRDGPPQRDGASRPGSAPRGRPSAGGRPSSGGRPSAGGRPAGGKGAPRSGGPRKGPPRGRPQR